MYLVGIYVMLVITSGCGNNLPKLCVGVRDFAHWIWQVLDYIALNSTMNKSEFARKDRILVVIFWIKFLDNLGVE